MVIDYTYPNYQLKRQIQEAVGKPYSFLEKLKLGGIGTSKLQVLEATDAIYNVLSKSADTKYCHVECRKGGLIVGFQSVMRVYLWLIPYHYLHMYNNGGLLLIYGNQENIKVTAPFNGSVDKKFIRKVLGLKAEYMQQYRLD